MIFKIYHGKVHMGSILCSTDFPFLWGNLKLNEQENTQYLIKLIGVDHIKPFLGCVNWIEWNVNQIKMLSIVKPHFKKKNFKES